jgi:hypothetical protein
MSQTVLVIKDASVQFADTQGGLAAAPDFTCQVVSAAVNANANLQTVPATFCAPESQAPAATSWSLDMNLLQDWGAIATAGSVSEYLFDNDAKRKWFLIQPYDPSVMGMQGECWLVASSYLGDAGTPLQASISCPLIGKPTKVAVRVHATGATAGLPGSFTPAGSDLPNSVADLIAGVPNAVVASPLTAWTVGQYVQTATSGVPGQAHWSGTAWVTGVA